MKHIFVFVFCFHCIISSALGQNGIQTTLQDRKREAQELMNKREFSQALQIWTDILKQKTEIAPDMTAFIRQQRGICYFELHADSSAIIDFSTSLELISHQQTFYERAKAQLRQKSYNLAFLDIEKALLREPDNASYYLLRGNIQFAKNKISDACQDFSMARVLGAIIPDDISSESCKQLGISLNNNVFNKPDSAAVATKTKSVADTALLNIISGTNNLNTTYYRWSVQAQYGGNTFMLSRLFYDVQPGNSILANIGYSPSRHLTLWAGGMYSRMFYTHNSERIRMARNAIPPFGEVFSWAALAGIRYSLIIEQNIDLQFGVGAGYTWLQFPSSVPIQYTNGDIAFANDGIPNTSGITAQVSLGAEWRFLKNLALTANGMLNLSSTRYVYFTLTRRDQENLHQFVNYNIGLRFYFDEQSE